MSQYAKVQKRIWNSRTFQSLSEDARFLWLYLLTCPHGNMIGIFVLKPGYVQEDLGWSSQRFNKSFMELLGKQLTDCSKGLVEYDEETKVIWIKNFLEHNPLKNPNQVKAACGIIEGLPYSELFEKVKLFIEQLGKQLYKPLGVLFAKPVAVAVAVTVTEEHIAQTSEVPSESEPEFTTIPLIDGSDFKVTNEMIAEWKSTYPDQDIEKSVREIRLWNISNSGRRKTRSGIMRHVASWLGRNNDKGKNMIGRGVSIYNDGHRSRKVAK